MNFRILFLSAASIAAISPAVSHASTENSAIDARASLRSKHGHAGIQRAGIQIEISQQAAGSAIAEYYSAHEYTFYLQAHDLKTGRRWRVQLASLIRAALKLRPPQRR